MFTSDIPFNPLSSPPSSPASLCLDSSPPSSPSLDSLVLDLPTPSLHPFAASVKANRTPPKYEKKYGTPQSVPRFHFNARSPKKPRYRIQENVDDDAYFSEPFTQVLPRFLDDPETSLWTEAITNVFDNGHGAVTLTDMNLTFIPAKIKDLENFVVLPEVSERNADLRPNASALSGGRLFTRVTTAPASTTENLFSSRNLNQRTRSVVDPSVGLAREDIQLFLSGNKISRLPQELFYLQKITVLIMRANSLTHIPPEISNLINLRELNISNNKIQYLPSEMLQLSLIQLHLHPNPFIPLPDSPSHSQQPLTRGILSRTNSHLGTALLRRRLVSQTSHLIPRIPSLSELCLRILFSPHRSDNLSRLETQYQLDTPECVLSLYGFPIPEDSAVPIPDHLKEIFAVCVPASVNIPSASTTLSCSALRSLSSVPNDAAVLTGIGACPSPGHSSTSVFVQHAEERFTWEASVAGINVGGAVPIKWRGCQWGCLDFLDPPEEVGVASGNRQGDVEMEEAEVVQVLQFNTGGIGLEDFE